MYNQYNLEANSSTKKLLKDFKFFLLSEKISGGSIRSYLSDVRFFLNWLINFLVNSRMIVFSNETNMAITLSKQVNTKVLETYKEFLLSSETPSKTINRRFSSLRRFGSFCQSQNWVSETPFDTLKNISPKKPFAEERYHLGEFRAELSRKHVSALTQKNYLADIKQFLVWMDKEK